MARFGAVSLAAFIPCLVLVLGMTGASGAYLIPGAERDNCSQQGMDCSFSSSNCLDPGWVFSHSYTPSGPDQLDLRISTRSDPNGNLLPVINASWTLRDEGSISFLKASELHVVVVSTNQNICVRYSFNNQLTMRSPTGDQWTLRSDVLVVDPGQIYRVSVENIPKPELDHSLFSISREVSVPDCSDAEMKHTQPCTESGALWSPNISLSQSSGTDLSVEFSPDPLSEQYLVVCRCERGRSKSIKTLSANRSRLSASFPLDLWVRACCRFHVEIKPFFSRCGNDCQRHSSVLDLCSKPSPAPSVDPWSPLPVALGLSSVLLLTLALGICWAIICKGKGGKGIQLPDPGPPSVPERPTLLLIYSRDHPLFRDVVLKLAAFLQARCGILVLLDLLDSSTVSQVGLMRWLELQRNKLRPNDKILVLCSHGVQSKWRAMCGQGHVAHQPDDLIGPFLSLFLSDMHQPGTMGRYIAAYFEEISSKYDVPSFFEIAVKYKLMKHFEELYFRVLDMEKYELRKVNHIEGIGPDEYFRCPSGRQLQNAIEKFQAFQIDNPDWFEKGEIEDFTESSLLIEDTQQPPLIMECVPFVREGPMVFTTEVLANENIENFYIVTPELNKNFLMSENEPILNAASQKQIVLEVQPDPRPNLEIYQSDVIPVIPAEGEDVVVPSMGQNRERVVGFLCQKPGSVEMAELDEIQAETSGSDQVAVTSAVTSAPFCPMGQNEAGVAGFPWSKADTSESDQGYSSKVWTEPDSDDLRALLQLQQELMSNIICHYDAQ